MKKYLVLNVFGFEKSQYGYSIYNMLTYSFWKEKRPNPTKIFAAGVEIGLIHWLELKSENKEIALKRAKTKWRLKNLNFGHLYIFDESDILEANGASDPIKFSEEAIKKIEQYGDKNSFVSIATQKIVDMLNEKQN